MSQPLEVSVSRVVSWSLSHGNHPHCKNRNTQSHLSDVEKTIVCFGVPVDPEVATFISFTDDEL